MTLGRLWDGQGSRIFIDVARPFLPFSRKFHLDRNVGCSMRCYACAYKFSLVPRLALQISNTEVYFEYGDSGAVSEHIGALPRSPGEVTTGRVYERRSISILIHISTLLFAERIETVIFLLAGYRNFSSSWCGSPADSLQILPFFLPITKPYRSGCLEVWKSVSRPSHRTRISRST